MTNPIEGTNTPTLIIFTEQLQVMMIILKMPVQGIFKAKAKFDDVQVTNGGNMNAEGDVTASGITCYFQKNQPFDIPHPVKKGYRLRHVCLEGPEAGVYYRGRITNSNVIELPSYLEGLVDPETISVNFNSN